jgi:hypothetical protein
LSKETGELPFLGTTTGGSWFGVLGVGGVLPTCNTPRQNSITTAFNFIPNGSSTESSPLSRIVAFGGLNELANRLRQKTLAFTDIDCCGTRLPCDMTGTCLGNFGRSFRGGNYLNMCRPALPPDFNNQRECDVTVFHELVHCCGGLEIDAWSLENHFYASHGTTSPGGGLKATFTAETLNLGGGLRAGTFVLWNTVTARVFVKTISGGSWLSSGTITPGAQILVDNTFGAY